MEEMLKMWLNLYETWSHNKLYDKLSNVFQKILKHIKEVMYIDILIFVK